MDYSFVIDIIGIIIGFVFIFLNVRYSRSLVGSIFKSYYRWVIVGAAAFTLGFLPELLAGYYGISKDMADSLHHLLLIIAGAIFVFTGLALHKEAAKYMKRQ